MPFDVRPRRAGLLQLRAEQRIVSDDVPISVLYTGAPVALVNRSGFDITPSHFREPNSE